MSLCLFLDLVNAFNNLIIHIAINFKVESEIFLFWAMSMTYLLRHLS